MTKAVAENKRREFCRVGKHSQGRKSSRYKKTECTSLALYASISAYLVTNAIREASDGSIIVNATELV